MPTKAGSKRVLVALHGLGGSVAGYRWMPEDLQIPDMNYLLVNAPDSYYGGYSWYDFSGDEGAGIRRSRGLLFELLDGLPARGFRPNAGGPQTCTSRDRAYSPAPDGEAAEACRRYRLPGRAPGRWCQSVGDFQPELSCMKRSLKRSGQSTPDLPSDLPLFRSRFPKPSVACPTGHACAWL